MSRMSTPHSDGPSTRSTRRQRTTRWSVGALTLCVALALPLSPTQARPLDAASPHSNEVKSASGKKASAVLNTLKVKSERASGYERDLFLHWTDADGDGCDAREEVLLEESQATLRPGRGCVIQGGRWLSPYDSALTTDPSTLDIDHMVPLAEAWASGGFRWNAKTREAFANDLKYDGSLVAVTASSNRSKGDSDPAEWLPPVQSYWCTYATTWIAVKYRWRLSIDPRERQALRVIVQGCGDSTMKLPPRGKGTGPGGGGGNNGGGGSGGNGDDPRFPTCSAAIAAGYGPYYLGIDPEYDWYIDRDGDGIVCE